MFVPIQYWEAVTEKSPKRQSKFSFCKIRNYLLKWHNKQFFQLTSQAHWTTDLNAKQTKLNFVDKASICMSTTNPKNFTE